MKKFFTSAVMGIIALFAVNLFSGLTGVGIPISEISLIAGAVLGIPGVISMVILTKF